jgi:hypothetical protein
MDHNFSFMRKLKSWRDRVDSNVGWRGNSLLSFVFFWQINYRNYALKTFLRHVPKEHKEFIYALKTSHVIREKVLRLKSS